jgi:nucleoside-diphosphate-sugar epimerase
MRILITGNGYIAKSLVNVLKLHPSHYNITQLTRADVDITDTEAVSKWFAKYDKFDVVIHTAVQGGSRLNIDNNDTITNNLKMFMNIHRNKHKFDYLIHFGSGAEIYANNTPYGLSKEIINEIVNATDNYYNLRIFAVFDENEIDTRFIKSCILNHINKRPIIVHQEKQMDFMHMHDFHGIVINYLTCFYQKLKPKKITECVYSKKYYLSNIAHFINTLDTHRVKIIIENYHFGTNYIGSQAAYQSNILFDRIADVYNKIKIKTFDSPKI